MKRGDFFKSLGALLIVPKVLGEVNFEKPPLAEKTISQGVANKSYISAISFLDLREVSAMTDLYGNDRLEEIERIVGRNFK